MVKEHLNKIFLSASIPYPERDKKYYDTADILAIRDAVRALATVVIPKAHLIWGGHPSITPMIRFVMDRMNVNVKEHVTLYQSLFFEDSFPEDNFAFEDVVLTAKADNLKESIEIMRKRLIEENDFKVGIFIGGMEGIEDEFKLFSNAHSNAIILPIASTGAAAKIIFDKSKQKFNSRLLDDYAYMALFRDFLSEYIN
jgi:SLOG cluster3 family